jgi:hypothetical protein
MKSISRYNASVLKMEDSRSIERWYSPVAFEGTINQETINEFVDFFHSPEF